MSKEDTSVPTVPKEWPGAFGLFKHSKQVVMVNLATLIFVWLLSVVVSGVFDRENYFGQLVSFLVSVLTSAAIVIAYLSGTRAKQIAFQDAIKQAWSFMLNMILFTILGALIAVGSLLLLIVPFFIVMPRLALANYYLIDQKMEVWDAYKASWAATKGHAAKVWGIIGVNFLMILLIFTIIGIPVAVYLLIMYSGSFAVLYRFLDKHNPPAKA